MFLIRTDSQSHRGGGDQNCIYHDDRVIPVRAQILLSTDGFVLGLARFLGGRALGFVVVGRRGGGEVVGFGGRLLGEGGRFLLGRFCRLRSFGVSVFG